MAIETAESPRRGDGKIAFLARLDTFQELFKAGHQQRKVFEKYESELGMSYSQFNRYVNKYIRAETADGHQRKGQGQKQSPSATAASTGGNSGSGGASPTPATSGKPASKRPPVFQHDPSSGNTRDDLI